MDEPQLSSAFYKPRNFAGCFSEGLHFLEENLRQIFQFSLVGLLPIGVLSAFCMTFMPPMPELIKSGPMMLTGLLLTALFGTIYLQAFLYAMLGKFAQQGAVPRLKLKGWWSLVRGLMRRSLLLTLVLSVCGVIAGYVASVPFFMGVASMQKSMVATGMDTAFPTGYAVGTLLLMLALVVGLLPLALSANFYLLEKQPLTRALAQSYRLGFSHWGALFGTVLLSSLVGIVVVIIGGLPFFLTNLIDYFVSLENGSGTEVVLPVYYLGLKFVFAFLATLSYYIVSMLVDIPVAFLYASLVARKRAKEKEREREAEIS